MIPQQTIARILDTASIEEVVREFVPLKKRGVNYIGLCPFHNEKTPSFTVSPGKGIYKCFGCGASGNVTKFLMEHEHYSFPEALRFLAQKYNIEIEETRDTEEEKASKNLQDSLYIIMAFAQDYFTGILFNTHEGKSIGLSYFKERGFRDDTIRKFHLGYALDDFSVFTQEAVGKGYQPELLKKLGLISEKEAGKRYDFFRGRVLFPIHNLSGKVIAFGGRTLKKDKSTPKYINSPESEIYHKSKVLYGAFFAKKAITEKDECFLVEGYTDVVSLHQGGIENVVASSGTALTHEQIRLIRRYTPNITILYDGDAAGIKAALRGLELVLEEGLNVKIVLLPDEEDPDSYIKKAGAAEFLQFVHKNKADFILFKTSQLLKDTQNDFAKKAEVIKDIVGTIALIPDPIKRSVYIKECSRLMGIEEQILVVETNKIKRKAFQKKTPADQEETTLLEQQAGPEFSTRQEGSYELSSDEFQERDVLRLLLEYGKKPMDENTSVTAYILKEITEIKFENPAYAAVIREFAEAFSQGVILEPDHFIKHADPAISKLAIEILTSPYELSENWSKKHDIFVADKNLLYRKDIESSLTRFKLKKVLQLIAENEKRLKETKDEQTYLAQMKIHHHLLKWKKELSKALGTVVVR